MPSLVQNATQFVRSYFFERLKLLCLELLSKSCATDRVISQRSTVVEMQRKNALSWRESYISVTIRFAKSGSKNQIHKGFLSHGKCSFRPTVIACEHQQPIASNCILFSFNQPISLASSGLCLSVPSLFTPWVMYFAITAVRSFG